MWPTSPCPPDPTCRIFALTIIRRTAASQAWPGPPHAGSPYTTTRLVRTEPMNRDPLLIAPQPSGRVPQVRLHPGLAGLLGRGQAYAGVSFSLDTCLPDISAACSIRGPDAMRLRKADHPRNCLAQRGHPTGCAKSACVFARPRLRPISRLLFSLSAYTPTPAVFPMASSPPLLLFPARLLLVFF